MNKTIEYINERIKMHEISKESALKIIKEYEVIVPVASYKRLVEEDDKNIQILQQIKTELEAWEVVKNSKIQIKENFVDKDCNDNIVITLIFKEKDFGKFEKALEVEDVDKKPR